jgi:hypothetical protein
MSDLPTKLYKSTITIWTEYNPLSVELVDLARDATSGDSFCEMHEFTEVTNPDEFPDTDFFGCDEEEDDE